MAYLTREDGERFVIPSYRDVISKRKTQLKNDILELSSRYGEYITLQRRGLAQFEVAFSREAGYLFGECVWHYFKRPADLIYCEAIPDTTEAYCVIVKEGSVYLDGAFPVENITEEIMAFTTQKTPFEIYVHGDVPISEQAVAGKISFDPQSMKSFTILEESLFQRLPPVKAYQFQLVDGVLRQHGIGVFPFKYIIAIVVGLGLAWMSFTYLTLHKKKLPTITIAAPENPFIEFNHTLMSVAPDTEIELVVAALQLLTTMPGWIPIDLTYSQGKITINVQSLGSNAALLYDWAAHNDAVVAILPGGFSLTMTLPLPPPRGVPDKIYPLDRVIISIIDRLAIFMPGNIVKVGAYKTQKVYKVSDVRIDLSEASPALVMMVAEQLKDLPLVLTNLSLKINHGLTGTIVLQALGS